MRISLRLPKWRAIGLAAIFAGAWTFGGCGSSQQGKMTSYSSQASKSATPELFTIPQDQMSHVQVVAVQPTKLTRTLRLTGSVEYNAFETTPVVSQVGGPVTRILVVPGDHVKQGQPMLEVSSPDYSQLLDTYLKAADASRLADRNYSRAQDLYQHQALAERDLQQAESDRDQARADLDAADQGLKILGVKNPADLSKAPANANIPVLAPISGEVVERLVSPGQVLQAGQTQAFTISNMGTVWVLANVYQSYLAYIHTGDNVVVQTDAYPDTFHGKISYISPALDPNTRTLQARVVVDNKGEKLKRQMYCTVVVTAGTVNNAIAVPDAAVLRDDENLPFVYVESGTNQFGRRSVRIGESTNGETQILSGLSTGDKVVGNGSLFLQFANSLQQ
ncbi:MAG TPA: efflux RND transporter periplasmic adaptor subunit [Candidatus Acidoferrales bacterium]|nr:efflux RND transporter periplasmic adaptor subunit [Candidatus Acidoferrales bacterium]